MNSAPPYVARLLMVCVTAAPLLVVVGIRAFTASALPHSASAAVDTDGDNERLQSAVLPEFTPADIDALARAQEIALITFTSPFMDATAVPEHVDPLPTTQQNHTEDIPPEMAVTSLLDSGRNTIAIIDGKAWRLAQEIAPGWVLVTINARDQYIEIESASGKRVLVPLTRH